MGVRAKQVVAVVAGFVVAGLMLMLGLWQMSSYQESTRDVSAERAAEAAVPLTESVAADGEVADVYGRRVTLTGSYTADEVLVGEEPPLRVVKSVVECGGMAQAELELNIGISTVSRHIKDLETRLGLTLCRRGRAV